MQAGKQNLLINKKASFKFDFYVLNAYNKALPVDDVGQDAIDLTGCTIAAKAKKNINDTTNLFTFTATIPEPTKGHCSLSLTAAQTSAMSWEKGVWDAFITFPSGDVIKYIEGNITLDKAAT